MGVARVKPRNKEVKLSVNAAPRHTRSLGNCVDAVAWAQLLNATVAAAPSARPSWTGSTVNASGASLRIVARSLGRWSRHPMSNTATGRLLPTLVSLVTSRS